jgi:putative ABC transport system permease protein
METWITVVGIAGDTREHTLEGEPTDQLYRPLFQGGNASRILVRATGDPLARSRQIRDAVHAVDPDQPVENLQTLDETRAGGVATRRLTMVLLGLFAGLALLITVTGIAAVIATSVSQRTREFGLRLALEAERASVLAMVMRQGLWLVGCGLMLGAVWAVAFGRVLSTFLYETAATDVATFAVVSLLFLLAGIGACFLPARRAMAVDPMVALRSE